jgi:DNA-binding response OmpR family regulator
VLKTGKKLLLTVEDDPDMSRVLVDRFELEGFDMMVAHDGEEGLAQALAHHPDLIILDILMPKMDGVMMIERLRADPWGENVPIVCLTNVQKPPEKLGERMKHDDNIDYIVKISTRLEDVVRRVNAVLDV